MNNHSSVRRDKFERVLSFLGSPARIVVARSLRTNVHIFSAIKASVLDAVNLNRETFQAVSRNGWMQNLLSRPEKAANIFV